MRVGQTRRRDWNERAIMAALRQIGCEVFPLSAPGLGDLLVWSRREGYRVLEVKTPRGRLTPDQVAVHQRVPVAVVRTVGEALALFGVQA